MKRRLSRGRRTSRRAGGAALKAALARVATLSALLFGVAAPALAGTPLKPDSFPASPLAVGGSHTCALPGDGTVVCWGDNTLGQLGSGAASDPAAPAGDVVVQQTVVADAASAAGRDCTDVTADGAVIRCRGSSSLTGVIAIAAGHSHTCALLVDTSVRCWGSNEAIDGGFFGASLLGGELGDGSTIAHPAPVAVIEGPGLRPLLTGVRALSAAAGYTCALLDDRTAKCWGDAPQTPSTAPIPVMADATTPLTQIVRIAAGDRNACAALVDGSVVCWGTGILGDQRSDTERDGHLPVTVTDAAGSATSLGGVTDLALGHTVFNGPNGFAMGHSCALRDTGEVACWGVNDVSQLGNGVIGSEGERDYAVPVVAGLGSGDHLRGVTAIAASGYATCALLEDGRVDCWGLGYGGDSFEGAGAPIPLDLAPGVVAIAGGGGTCAVAADGAVWCSDADLAMLPVPGIAIAAPAPEPTTTPVPTGAAGTDVDGLAGAWAVTYGSPAVATISFADGVYSVTATSPVQVIGSACSLPAGTLLATFSGSGGTYTGQHGLWSTGSCTFGTWAPIAATLDRADQLTMSFVGSSTTIVFTREPAPAAAEDVVGAWQGGAYSISFSNGIYEVTNLVTRTIAGSACTVEAGRVTQTFSGSDGNYRGQELGWNLADCSTTWLPATFTFRGDTLTFFHDRTGVTEVWHRAAAAQPEPVSFRNSIPWPGRINLSPAVVIQTVVFAAGIIVLVPFPGALFNSTLEGNYPEIMRRVRRGRQRVRDIALRPWRAVRRRPGAVVAAAPVSMADAGMAVDEEAPGSKRDFWWTPIGIGLFILLTVLLSGFLDPSFGFDAGSIATFVGMLLGLLALLAAFDLPLAIFYRRRAIGFSLHALPATVAVSVACVLISRLTDFHPGYLYGLIIATAAATKLDKPTEGRLMAAGVASSLLVSVVAWFGLGVVGPLAAESPDPETWLIVVQTALAMVVAAGVELAAFGMLPLTFLVGKTIFDWNRLVWAGLIGFGWIAFGIVILNPQNGYLSDTTRTPLFTVVALLLFFGVGSILFWYYFHRRRAVGEAAA